MAPKTKAKAETIVVEVATCTRCNYRWVPDFEFDHWKKNRTDGTVRKPATCAHCHSPYYDQLRRNNGKNS